MYSGLDLHVPRLLAKCEALMLIMHMLVLN